MSRTRTHLRRTAVVVSTTLVLALLPAAAYAADDTAPAATTGGAVTVTTKVVAAFAVLGLAYRRGTVLLVLFALAAGVMLAGTSFGGTLASLADNIVRAGINAVTGIFA
ncbi:hypothetical protein [Streptodolium elevatio]|uniref:Uncharacterized protein n=1 Tax=Streptodolium elevatio TaxID=3157996 RepID=A0ABV3DTD4_9ACTN